MRLTPILLGIAFTTSALAEGVTPVVPATPGAQMDFNLTAEVTGICGVYSVTNASTTTSFDVDFGDLGVVPTTTFVEAEAPGVGTDVPLSYTCNLVGGFSRTVTSDNGGYLFREGTTGGTGDKIAYQMAHSGDNGLSFVYQQLVSPVVTDHVNVAFLDGEVGSVSFRANGVLNLAGVESFSTGGTVPHTTAYAGDYADKVTIAITAN